jgi:hypothetical protein
MGRITSDLDRLHESIDALPPQQVYALLTLLESQRPLTDEEFARRLAEAPEEEAGEETVARILAAEAEQGESISHGDLKQRLELLEEHLHLYLKTLGGCYAPLNRRLPGSCLRTPAWASTESWSTWVRAGWAPSGAVRKHGLSHLTVIKLWWNPAYFIPWRIIMNRRIFIRSVIPCGLAGVALAQKAVKQDRLSGIVKSVDKGKMTIEMRGRTNANIVRQIMYDANTRFTMQGKPGTADDLKESLRIVAVGKFEGVNLKATQVALTQR